MVGPDAVGRTATTHEEGRAAGPSQLGSADGPGADLLTDAARRLSASPVYARVAPAEIRRKLEEAADARCVAEAASETHEPDLFVWAEVTPDVSRRFEVVPELPEIALLQAKEWRGGGELWLLELLANARSPAACVAAFRRSIGSRHLRLGRSVAALIAKGVVADPAPDPSSPRSNGWMAGWDGAPVPIEGHGHVLRRLAEADAEHVASWMSAPEVGPAMASTARSWSVQEVRTLIGSAEERGQLLLAVAPPGTGSPVGFFMASRPSGTGMFYLSMVMGAGRLRQEIAIAAGRTVISWLFERPGADAVAMRVAAQNRVVVNWLSRVLQDRAPPIPLEGVPDGVHDFRIRKAEWAEILKASLARSAARRWRQVGPWRSDV